LDANLPGTAVQLILHNTLTRKKEAFAPIDPNRVRLYACGPTVYDFAHIGNGRMVVVFDLLFRVLRRHYGAEHVVYVRNITDIDDKIINGARESGEPIDALTRRTTEAFHADMAALGALAPSHEPRATEHIREMIAMIERLIAGGHAYAAEGHVLFHVPSDPEYGKLSGRNREEQIDGARVEVAPYKRDPADFVLWKPSSDDQPGWKSPWGRGRPGWHIECSAMSEALLGETFDIHGGGLDLVFPHHENEIAQSECVHGKPFARHWVHNGWVMVNGEKMSKSLGNHRTVRELLDQGIPGEVLRLVLLGTHYRQPLDFTEQAVAQAKQQLDRFYGALRSVGAAGIPLTPGELPAQVLDALDDDLNAPLALARIHEIAGELNMANSKRDRAGQEKLSGALLAAGHVMGLLSQDPEAWFKGRAGDARGEEDKEIESLIAARNAARKAKDFAEADRIRKVLLEREILLEDTPQGTIWRSAGSMKLTPRGGEGNKS
jgi:cysteinyl-tRNA synthetase